MQRKSSKVRIKIARYSLGQHVRISKEKAKFAKSAEQNFSRGLSNHQGDTQDTAPRV